MRRAAPAAAAAPAEDVKSYNEQIFALKNEITNAMSKRAKVLKDIRTLRSSEAINKKMKLIGKRKAALLRNIEELNMMLSKTDLKMDENIEAIELTIEKEIDQIKNNMEDLKTKQAKRKKEINSQIHFFKECEEQIKICMEENIQLWEDKLNDVKNGMQNTYQVMQRKQDANKLSFHRKIQAMKEIEAEEILNMEKETEILQKEYNELEKKIHVIQQSRAKASSELRAGIQNLQRIADHLNTEAMQHHTYAVSTYSTSGLEYAAHVHASGHGPYCLPQYQPSSSDRLSSYY